MFGWDPATRIYLAAGVTGVRMGFEGLYGLMRDRLSCDPPSGWNGCVIRTRRIAAFRALALWVEAQAAGEMPLPLAGGRLCLLAVSDASSIPASAESQQAAELNQQLQ